MCKNENDLRIIPDTSENYKSISLKIEVDEYEQKYDQTKCKICKCKFRELLKECKGCKSSGKNLTIRKNGSKQKLYIDIRFIDKLSFLNTSLEKQ